MIEAIELLALAALLLAALAVSTWNPLAGVCLLAITASLQGVVYAQFQGLDIRPYEMVLIGLIGALILNRRAPRLDWLALAAVLYPASGFLGLNVSVSKRDTVTSIFFEFVMVAILLTVRTALRSERELRFAVLFVTVGVANTIALFGLLQFVGYYLGFHISYFAPGLSPIFRPYSTFTEPDLFAAFIVSTAVISFALVGSPAFRRWRWVLLTSGVFQLLLMVLSEVRGAWVGFVVAIVALVALDVFRTRRLGAPAATLGSALIGVGALAAILRFASPRTFQALATRVKDTIYPFNEGTASARLYDFEQSILYWKLHPIFGNGVGTWGRVFSGLNGREARVPPRNLELSLLYEKGIVGLAITFAMYAVLLISAARSYFSDNIGLGARHLSLALLVSVVAVLITFQFTRIDIQSHYWLTLGFLAVAGDLRRSGRTMDVAPDRFAEAQT